MNTLPEARSYLNHAERTLDDNQGEPDATSNGYSQMAIAYALIEIADQLGEIQLSLDNLVAATKET